MERRSSLKKIKEKRDSREHKAHFVGPSFDVIPLRLGNITIKQRMANHGEKHGHHPTQPHSLRFDGRGRLRMPKQGNKKVEVETEVRNVELFAC